MALPARPATGRVPTAAPAADYGRCGLPFACQSSRKAHPESSHDASSRLVAAAAVGDVASAARALADGADWNFQDSSSGVTPLHRAAQRGHVPTLELLLAAGADANRADHEQRTPLFAAANAGSLQAVRILLAHGAQLFPAVRTHCVCSSSCGSNPRVCTCGASASASGAPQSQPRPQTQGEAQNAGRADADDAAFLALRSTCPLAAAAAAARWPIVAALLVALPPHYQRLPSALCSLRFLVWALASHKAFPREVIRRMPRRLPACVVDAVRPAYLASTPLVLATGNDQQQLMQWLLQQGADPELGAPLLLCAGRFCHGSRTCCVSTLLRRGAAPHVAWADNPADSPLLLAARGDCFTHVHCLVAYGADVGGEAARVREALYAPAPWEAHLDGLVRRNGALLAAPGAEALLCPCGQQHGSWPGLWPLDGEEEGTETEAEVEVEDGGQEPKRGVEGEGAGAEGAQEGGSGNSCLNNRPSDDAWYRHNRVQMEQLQDGNELADCRKAVDDLWRYGCSAVVSELGGPPAAPHSLLPQRVLDAMQDVASGWLAAALRCRQQRQLRADLYDNAVAAGRRLLDQKRIAALAALGGAGLRNRQAAVEVLPEAPGGGAGDESSPNESEGGLVAELRMEIMSMAGLAPPGVETRVLSQPPRKSCRCSGCSSSGEQLEG